MPPLLHAATFFRKGISVGSEFYKLYTVLGGLQYFECPLLDTYRLVEFRYLLIVLQEESRKRNIVVGFGKRQSKTMIDSVYLEASR